MKQGIPEKIAELEDRLDNLEDFLAFAYKEQIMSSVVALTKAVHLLTERFSSDEIHALLRQAAECSTVPKKTIKQLIKDKK